MPIIIMSHFFVGDLHGCYELRPLEVNSYMPLVAAHWNMAISAMDHCVSISATKADRLDGGGVNECETESVFSSRGEKKGLVLVHEVQEHRTRIGAS